jgi:hypothetical protein
MSEIKLNAKQKKLAVSAFSPSVFAAQAALKQDPRGRMLRRSRQPSNINSISMLVNAPKCIRYVASFHVYGEVL